MSAPFAADGPHWFTIPAHRPFVEDLAAGLLAALSDGGPEALSEAIVLTPTRRGARSLADAFVRAGGGRAVLLPQIRALGDLDEGEPPFEPGDLALDLPPAISPLRRRFELARLVAGNAGMFDRPLDAAGVLELADALAGFLDSLQIEETTDLGRVATLVEGDLAQHWLKSAKFLRIATERWPERLRQMGLADVTDRRTALLRALGEAWTAKPPAGPLVAAGSTGTAPATADLLRVIAAAPKGAVVLPGLDLDLAETAWDQVREAHPQGAMHRLLARAKVERADVGVWSAPETLEQARRGRARRRVINEALRPAEATADWVGVIQRLRDQSPDADPIAEGMAGLSLVTTRTEEEAAATAALLLREALEVPGKTAALVTPDPALARRVSARLSRWAVTADSSAGSPLLGAPVGVLTALVAAAVADPLDPVRLLAICKHPLAGFGLDQEALAAARTKLERRGLRGARPRDWAEVRRRLDAAAAWTAPGDYADAIALAEGLQGILQTAAAPFSDGDANPVDAARALAAAIEAICAEPAGGTGRLWAGLAGEAAASLLAGIIEDGDGLPPATASGFAVLVERLLASQTVRSGSAAHPRLRILGAIEARLIRADVLVLAGLEEGVWPRIPTADPFLSRPMRARLDLPPPERRIGLAAHDFAQAACAPEVTLIHVERRGGQPAVKSRWLWRLETLARGAGVAIPGRPDALAWARALEAPVEAPPPTLQQARPPEPRPPVAARPRGLFVTQVEALVRDPYAIYARHILGFRQMERPDERVEVRIRGTAIHKAFERFSGAWPEADPALFARLYLDELRAAGATEGSLARETALADRAGRWVTDFERERRKPGVEVKVEQTGCFDVPGADFRVSAKADRIEVVGREVHVLDFKTGRAPTAKEIATGFSPQLTLTAAIVAGGGFDGLAAHVPGELVYVRVTGREPAGEMVIRAAPGESEAMAAQALEGLAALVRRYDDPEQPYRSRTAPRFVKTYAGDYDHLARVREWSAGDEEDGE
ncbi:MAG: double-strand break repair protein AddB [Caulobacterales bacterium 32-69-10]|nr:MAG: double-strand break repair protein AddB [Caulobacterales bacterium 32-69-10]